MTSTFDCISSLITNDCPLTEVKAANNIWTKNKHLSLCSNTIIQYSYGMTLKKSYRMILYEALDGVVEDGPEGVFLGFYSLRELVSEVMCNAADE